MLCAAPPEALAHSPSQMPQSCPVAPASQRELHKDVGGGGGGVAGRARAARALKAKSCATSRGTSSATPCAASFTCPSFICHLRAGVGGGGSRPGRHVPQHSLFFPERLRSPRPLSARPSRVDRHCDWTGVPGAAEYDAALSRKIKLKQAKAAAAAAAAAAASSSSVVAAPVIPEVSERTEEEFFD